MLLGGGCQMSLRTWSSAGGGCMPEGMHHRDPSNAAYKMLCVLQNKYHILAGEGNHFHARLLHRHQLYMQMLQIHNYRLFP